MTAGVPSGVADRDGRREEGVDLLPIPPSLSFLPQESTFCYLHLPGTFTYVSAYSFYAALQV